MKIAFLCNEYPPFSYGGIGVYVRNMAKALTKEGHKVIVIGVYPGFSKIFRQWDGAVKIYRLPALRLKKVSWLLNRLWLSGWITQLFHLGAFDLIEYPDYEGWSLLLPTWIPQVMRLHSSSYVLQCYLNDRIKKNKLFFLEKVSLIKSKLIVASSKYIGEVTKKVFDIPWMEYKVVHNWTFLPEQGNNQYEINDTVLFFGTISKIKGIDILINAWPFVIEQYPSARLLIAGKDSTKSPYLPGLLNNIPKKIQNTIKYLGILPHQKMMETIKLATTICLPSLFEAFGLAVIESMACQKAVIFNKDGVGPEIITNGIDGLLVDTSNPREIAEAILWLLHHPDARRHMAQRARLTVEQKFSREVILPLNLEFYEKVKIGNIAAT